MIKVIIKEPGRSPYFREIENTLESFQNIVGGYIETLTIASDLVIVLNEEGRLKNLPYNCVFCGAELVGTIIFAGVDGDEFADVPKGMDIILKSIKE
jgi:hypothetical protein